MKDDEVIAGLLARPKEALSVELKAWFDPARPAGQAKVIKGAIALRNNGGGHMLIGINDDGTPDASNAPSDPARSFDPDTIQGLVSRHSAELFEIDVSVRRHDGHAFVVISVPGGVTVPCAAKKPLSAGPDERERELVKTDAVYVRTLSSNGTVSTGEARHGDWARIMRICFDNREADVGQFIRRHINADAIAHLRNVLGAPSQPSPPSAKDQALRALEEGVVAQEAMISDRKLEFERHGRYMVAAVLGERDDLSANQEILNRLFRVQPRYTGWPAWIDSRGFQDQSTHPFVKDDRWNAFIVVPGRTATFEFWSMDPRRGTWFLSRALEDDAARSEADRLQELDFALPIRRLAEALAVLREFALALDYPIESTSIDAVFRWTGLKNRHLTAWAHPARSFHPRGPSHDDTVQSFVSVPLAVGPDSLGPHIYSAVTPLHRVFEGMEFGQAVIDDIVRETFHRQ